MATVFPVKSTRSAYPVYSGVNPFFNRDLAALNSLFDDFFAPVRTHVSGSGFRMDVQESDTEYTLTADLPGVAREDVSLSLKEGVLTIAVKKDEQKEEQNQGYLHRERRSYSASRQVYLKDSASDGIKAKLENGVLTLNIPKKQEAENKIEIQVD